MRGWDLSGGSLGRGVRGDGLVSLGYVGVSGGVKLGLGWIELDQWIGLERWLALDRIGLDRTGSLKRTGVGRIDFLMRSCDSLFLFLLESMVRSLFRCFWKVGSVLMLIRWTRE